jgi:hypothetical protein
MERGLKYNGFMAQVSGEEDGAAVSGTLQGQCHELEYILFRRSKHFNQSVLSVSAVMVFKIFQKLFTTLYNN